jgi:O-acetyl-ADP-ribose deacetylase (regulator of RNase III)
MQGRYGDHSLEVWVADDIVSSISLTHAALSNDVLINPANKTLSGTACPYFPVGGPLPKGELGRHSNWGGLEAGEGMRYPTQCVDGRVHMEGGAELKQLLLCHDGCKVGGAVVTRAVGGLSAGAGGCSYKYVIHTVPPLASNAFSKTLSCLSQADIDSSLTSCYLSSLNLASTLSDADVGLGAGGDGSVGVGGGVRTIASPLLGAGTAGLSTQRCGAALREALLQHPSLHPSQHSLHSHHSHGFSTGMTLRLVVQREEDAELVSEVLFGKPEER